MKVDRKRIDQYLDQIAAETTDIQNALKREDDVILSDGHLLKSLKYSVIVLAEAVAGTLQHILAKQHNAMVDGYMDVFDKTRRYHVVSKELLERLQPFIVFRNMLVHQYWRVNDLVFLSNMRSGMEDFRNFTNEINDLFPISGSAKK